MPPTDPLLDAAIEYAVYNWSEVDWRAFCRSTGTTHLLNASPRLLKSLSWNNTDYPDEALKLLKRVMEEAPEPGSGKQGRIDLVAEAMPNLGAYLLDAAPPLTRRRFKSFMEEASNCRLPASWLSSLDTSGQPPSGKLAQLESKKPQSEETPSASAQVRADSKPSAFARDKEVHPTDGLFSIPGAIPLPSLDSEAAILSIEAEPQLKPVAIVPTPEPKKIFVVHGHDSDALNAVRIFVHRETDIMPISLAEEAGSGDTIIEKFERFGSAADFAVILLTPDDVGQTAGGYADGVQPRSRARQNVVLEFGYFLARLGRKRMVVIDCEVERPSDINGLAYIKYEKANDSWKYGLLQELKAAGLTRS